MLQHGRPYGCGSWLPEDKKDNHDSKKDVWLGYFRCDVQCVNIMKTYLGKHIFFGFIIMFEFQKRISETI